MERTATELSLSGDDRKPKQEIHPPEACGLTRAVRVEWQPNGPTIQTVETVEQERRGTGKDSTQFAKAKRAKTQG